MKKVKLTKEQAEAVEEVKMNLSKSSAIEIHVDGWKDEHLTCLNELSTDGFVRVLYFGYEVAPELKEGDLVYHPFSNSIGEVKGDIVYWDDGIKNDLESVKNMFHYNEVQLADSEKVQRYKEQKWWSNHGRDVWEVKAGDFIVDSEMRAYEITSTGSNYCFLDNTHATYDFIKENFKLLCFVEDRKDLD